MGCSAHVIPTQRQTSVAPDPAGGPLTTLPRESFVLALADGPPPARLPKSVVLDGPMRQKTRALSTPIAAEHIAGYGWPRMYVAVSHRWDRHRTWISNKSSAIGIVVVVLVVKS